MGSGCRLLAQNEMPDSVQARRLLQLLRNPSNGLRDLGPATPEYQSMRSSDDMWLSFNRVRTALEV